MAGLRVTNSDLQTGGLLIAGRNYRLANGLLVAVRKYRIASWRPAAGVVENIDLPVGGAADRARLSQLANEDTLGYFVGVPSTRARARGTR